MLLPPRYAKEKSLHGGGMSDALLCNDTHLDRLVVIKALKPDTDPKRLLGEIRALQAIRSRHVVQIYDVLRDSKGGVYALVEEYIEGDDLTGLAPPPDADGLLKLLYPIANGIAEIHAHGHIHRDIKRQNMKFDGEGCLKIYDFGLSKEDTASASTVGAFGTPGYMAPELFLSDADGTTKITSAVDVYAFGATAIALSLGTLPKGLKDLPPKLPAADADFRKLAQKLPPEIADLLNGCLDASLAKRPQMQSVANALSRYILRGKHRALIGLGGRVYTLDANNAVVDLSVQGQGSLRIAYDGLQFVVSNITGHVAINNKAAVSGVALPGACVIVLGAPYPNPRTAITVDVSHPEVTL
jgi:eukaryotic-like serine/threonine-protein kinase